MAEREVRIRFTGENGVLKGQAGELRTLFQNLINDTDDVRTAGEKWAAAHKAQSDRIEQDMRDVAQSAKVLADSLGPEMVAALDRSGRSVEDHVQELVRLGLTHDDIRMSSDQLADALRRRDDVLRQSSGQVGDGLRRVADEADNSRSVLANMVGNSAQDIGALAGVSGTAGMAIGQLAEYATEGNISLTGLAKTAGPMLLLAGGLQILAQEQANAAREAKALTDAQEQLAEGRVADAAATLVEQYSLLYDEFQKLGVGSDEVTAALTGNAEAFDAVQGAAFRADMAQDGLAQTAPLLMQRLKDAQEGWANTAEELARNEQLTNEVAAALTGATGAVEDNTEALREAENAQRAVNDARLASIDSAYAVTEAEDRYTQALEAAAGAQDDVATGVDEYRQAQDEAAQAALGVAAAEVRKAEDLAAANGQTLSAREANYLMIESLYGLVLSLDENSPVRAALVEHIATLQGVPTGVGTNVDVTVTGTEDAATRIGGVRASVDEVNDTPVAVDAAATVDTAVAEVDRLQVAIEGVPATVATEFRMDVGRAIRDVNALISRMQALETAARRAEQEVSRVAD